MGHLIRLPSPNVPKVVYLSADRDDLPSLKEAEDKVIELGHGSYLVHEPLLEWKQLQELKVLDRQRRISLEFLILRTGSHEVKEEILFNNAHKNINAHEHADKHANTHEHTYKYANSYKNFNTNKHTNCNPQAISLLLFAKYDARCLGGLVRRHIRSQF